MYMTNSFIFLHFATISAPFYRKMCEKSRLFPFLIHIPRTFSAKAVTLQPFCRKAKLISLMSIKIKQKPRKTLSSVLKLTFLVLIAAKNSSKVNCRIVFSTIITTLRAKHSKEINKQNKSSRTTRQQHRNINK